MPSLFRFKYAYIPFSISLWTYETSYSYVQYFEYRIFGTLIAINTYVKE